MIYEFNKKLLLSNIAFLLEESGKKIGELEKDAGVSTGYISRLAKEENSKPGIEFIMGVAEALNVNVDTLLKANLAEIPATVLYLSKFLSKLEFDTLANKLDWRKETKVSLEQYMRDAYGNVEHRMLSYAGYHEQRGAGIREEDMEEEGFVTFNSHSFGYNTAFFGDWFSLRLKNQHILYLVNISKRKYLMRDNNDLVKEIWIVPQSGENKYICSTKENKNLADMIEKLYTVVADRIKIPRFEKEVVDTIDAFMKDDWVDDQPNDYDLPF